MTVTLALHAAAILWLAAALFGLPAGYALGWAADRWAPASRMPPPPPRARAASNSLDEWARLAASWNTHVAPTAQRSFA
jgi:hypothetical protein